LSGSHFSNEDFRKFQEADTNAAKETQVVTDVIPSIQGNIKDRKCVSGDVPFTNLNHLTDGTLVPANPDLYYGARPEQLDPKVRRELNKYIIPSTQHDLPITPNFFLEVKGPEGLPAVAKRQLTYNIALGAKGYDKLRSYGVSDPVFDNKACTIGCTYYDGVLKMYTSHPIEPSIHGKQPGFVMKQLDVFTLTKDLDTFQQGVAAYRNGRDWAKQQRDQAIAQANERAGLESTESAS
jgi:hypothetical protein